MYQEFNAHHRVYGNPDEASVDKAGKPRAFPDGTPITEEQYRRNLRRAARRRYQADDTGYWDKFN